MKRRGRQPKEKKENIENENAIIEEVNISTTVKKRESKKKKFSVVAIVTPDGITGEFVQEQRRPLIAKIPIHSSEVIFHDTPVKYDKEPPKEPQPFDSEFEEYNIVNL
jgi:hypothetical protein